MICLKGDEVRLKSGETGEIIDTWGVARNWCKVKSSNGKIIYTMTENIETIISRESDRKRRKWR